MSLASLATAQAAAAFKRYGAPVAYTHVTTGTGPDTTGDTETTKNTFGALDASSFVGLGYKFGADLIKVGDHLLSLAGGLGFEPSVGDYLTVLGARWSVVAVKPLYVGATAVSYELAVRR